MRIYLAVYGPKLLAVSGGLEEKTKAARFAECATPYN